jgi:peroxiredoxin
MTKKLIYLILFSSFCWTKKGISQIDDKATEAIPLRYESSFKEDQKRYDEFIHPYLSITGDAFTKWSNYNKGYLKGCDVDSLYRIFYAAKNQELSKIIEFIKLNPNSYASLRNFRLWLLNTTRIKPDSLLIVYSFLSPDLQNTVLGKSVLVSINRKQSLLLNQAMPNFSFRSNSEEMVELSDFKGKNYVLLCFWASWCGPCVRNIPFLKKISETFSPKGLKMISVSIDENVNNWKSTIVKHGLTWLQTCDLPYYAGKNKISTLYEIAFIPQYFLLDKEGKLIYQSILSKDDEEHSRLSSLLANVYK